MLRSLTLLALVATAALPAAAQIRKCQGPNGLSFADGKCPPGTKALDVLPETKAAAGAATGSAVPDAPLAAIETGIPVITQLAGKFAWLDADTLAITTFGDPKAKVPWMVRKIVAFDVATNATSTLVPRGFIDCANAEFDLVGLEIGDLESRFAVGSTAAPAVQQFRLWDAASRTLVPAPADYKAGWHPKACLKPAPEDLAIDDLLGNKKPVRYLQPEHGTLEWASLDAQGHPEGPSLHTPKRKIMLAGLSINEISHDVRYLPFRNGYQLAAGVHDRAFEPPHDSPMITMDLDGRLARHAIPPALTHALDAAGASGPATMAGVKPGELVSQPGTPQNGGGFYLVQGEHAKRIWCTGTPAPGQAAGAGACAMTQQVAVSPDGCRIAFDAPPVSLVAAPFTGAPTVKVIELCTAADKAPKGGRKTHS
jgi:hypothetical protein